MSSSAKKSLTALEIEFLTSSVGYKQFVAGLASPAAKLKFSPTVVALLVDELQSLNQVSVTLDHLKRVITYGDKLRMNPSPRYSGELANHEALTANGDLIHGLLGKMTEAIELAPLLISLLKGEAFDAVNLCEELGDDEFYTQLARSGAYLSREHVLATNVRKLEDRYDGLTFSAEKALQRDLDSERRVLEGGDDNPDAQEN